jgi:S1-C subfamily serine protease
MSYYESGAEEWAHQAAPPPPPPPRASGWRAPVAVVLALALLGLAAGAGAGWALGRATLRGPAATSPIRASSQASTGSLDAQAIAAKVDPAIVDIETTIQSGSGSGQGAATGMIVTPSGQILTNNHVVQGATSIKVTIAGHSGTVSANVLGVDPTADVALIQAQGVRNLPVVKLADSSTLRVGQAVVAIGNALGRGGAPSVTSGSVTALDQSITASDYGAGAENLTGMIETDAPISAGDSGGAVVNSAGQVVGMITAGQVRGFRRTSSSIGYAVPTNKALDIVNQVRAGKASSEIFIGEVGYLGVQVRDLDAATAAQLGLDAGSGVLVAGTPNGSPAAQAGIGDGAVITSVDGHQVATTVALGAALHVHKPGDRVQVNWTDASGSHSATVALTSGPPV